MSLNNDIDIKKCYGLLKQYNIWNDDYNVLRKNFKLFVLKNHPDKGGVKEVFQSVSSCKDILDDDFNYFKDIANKSDVYDYNEEKVTYDYDYDFDNSRDEDFNSNIKSKTKSKANSKAKVPKYTYIDFETFVKKECTGSGGWLSEELRNFCTILGLNNKGKKEELCKRLSTYFASINTINPETVKQKQSIGIATANDMKNILEKVYKEQQRIREEEFNLNEKMSNLSVNV